VPGVQVATSRAPTAERLAARKRDRRAPFRRGDGPVRALVLHGLSGSPHEVRGFATALADLGLAVHAPLLPGHEDLDALAETTAEAFLTAAESAFDDLADGAAHVLVVGFSMGALLALCLCARRRSQVTAALCAGTPLWLARPSQLAIDALARLAGRTRWPHALAPVVKGLPDVRLATEAVSNPGLMAFPAPTLAAFGRLQALARTALPHVTCPLGILHGRHDHTAPVSNADRLVAAVPSSRVELRILRDSFHLVGVDLEADEAVAFVRAFAARTLPAPT